MIDKKGSLHPKPGDETSDVDGPLSPGALGLRIAAILDLFEDRRSAAAVSGRKEDMLRGYASGRHDPPFAVVARLALDRGVSLDWVATGDGEMRRSDARRAHQGDIEHDGDLLVEMVEAAHNWAQAQRPSITPREFAHITAILYRHAWRRREINSGRGTASLRQAADEDLAVLQDFLKTSVSKT